METIIRRSFHQRWLKLSHKLTRGLYSAFGINFYEDKHLFGREKLTMKGKMNATTVGYLSMLSLLPSAMNHSTRNDAEKAKVHSSSGCWFSFA